MGGTIKPSEEKAISLTSTASTLDDFLTPANSTPKPVRQMAQQPPTIKPAPTPIPAPAPRPKPVVTQRAAPADADDPPKWACQKCTFHNLIGIDICEMCGKSSPMRLANLAKRRSSPALPPPITTPSQYTQNYPGVQAASARRSIGTVRSVDNIGMSAGSGVPIAVIEAEPVDWRISNGGDRIGRPQSAQYSRPPMAKLAPMPSAGGELLRVPIVIQVRTKKIFKKWKPAVLVLTDTHMSVYNVRNGETTRRASVEPFSPSRFPARGEASSPFADSPPGRAPANDNVGDDGDVGTAIRCVPIHPFMAFTAVSTVKDRVISKDPFSGSRKASRMKHLHMTTLRENPPHVVMSSPEIRALQRFDLRAKVEDIVTIASDTRRVTEDVIEAVLTLVAAVRNQKLGR